MNNSSFSESGMRLIPLSSVLLKDEVRANRLVQLQRFNTGWALCYSNIQIFNWNFDNLSNDLFVTADNCCCQQFSWAKTFLMFLLNNYTHEYTHINTHMYTLLCEDTVGKYRVNYIPGKLLLRSGHSLSWSQASQHQAPMKSDIHWLIIRTREHD